MTIPQTWKHRRSRKEHAVNVCWCCTELHCGFNKHQGVYICCYVSIYIYWYIMLYQCDILICIYIIIYIYIILYHKVQLSCLKRCSSFPVAPSGRTLPSPKALSIRKAFAIFSEAAKSTRPDANRTARCRSTWLSAPWPPWDTWKLPRLLSRSLGCIEIWHCLILNILDVCHFKIFQVHFLAHSKPLVLSCFSCYVDQLPGLWQALDSRLHARSQKLPDSGQHSASWSPNSCAPTASNDYPDQSIQQFTWYAVYMRNRHFMW